MIKIPGDPNPCDVALKPLAAAGMLDTLLVGSRFFGMFWSTEESTARFSGA